MSIVVRHYDTIFDWECCDDCLTTDEFRETEHPRGQPENKGEFVAKGQGAASSGTPAKSAKAAHLQPANPDRTQWPNHIQALRVPPAWTNVQISPDPKAPLQVIGQDAKGRKQYVYHQRFAQSQAEKKFSRIKELDRKFKMVQLQNEKNRSHKNPSMRDHADAAALVMHTGMRPGSETDTGAEHQGYGATTLEGQHVVNMGDDKLNLRFVPGKKHGQSVDMPVDDPSIVKMLRARAAMAGPDGQLFPSVSAQSLLNYIHTFDGGGFKSKDLRTLVAARTAKDMIAKFPVPQNPMQYKKSVKEVATQVATKLGNSATVALQSYIPPILFAEWRSAAGV